MTTTKTFHIGDIISATTGTLVSPRLIAGVHELLDWVTGDTLMTHQLPRASRECEDFLREQFPELPTETPSFDGMFSVAAWLHAMVTERGATREVPRMPAEDHTHIDPITEFRMIRPDVDAVVIVTGGQ